MKIPSNLEFLDLAPPSDATPQATLFIPVRVGNSMEVALTQPSQGVDALLLHDALSRYGLESRPSFLGGALSLEELEEVAELEEFFRPPEAEAEAEDFVFVDWTEQGVEATEDHGAVGGEEIPVAQPVKVGFLQSKIDAYDLKKTCRRYGYDPNEFEFEHQKDVRGKPVRILKRRNSVESSIRQAVEILRAALDEVIKIVQQDNSLEKHINGCVETMVDGVEGRNALKAQLSNTRYSSSNFTSFAAHPSNPSMFIACFGEHQLAFSNRQSSFETRGEILRDLLSTREYSCLQKLLASIYLTKDDHYLLAATNIIRVKLAEVAGTLDLSPASVQEVKRRLSHFNFMGVLLKDLHPDFFSE